MTLENERLNAELTEAKSAYDSHAGRLQLKVSNAEEESARTIEQSLGLEAALRSELAEVQRNAYAAAQRV